MFTIIGGDGKEYGPVTAEQIRAWIAAGRANLDTKARREGDSEWRRLGEWPEFAAGSPLVPPVMETTGPAAGTPLANRSTRLAAAALDFIFAMVCFIPVGFFVGFSNLAQIVTSQSQGSDLHMQMFLLYGAIPVLVVQGILLSLRGQSVGKLLLKIRIVRTPGETPARFVHAFLLRMIVPAILGVIPLIGSLFSIVDVLFIFRADRRCIHDLIAGTAVVRCD